MKKRIIFLSILVIIIAIVSSLILVKLKQRTGAINQPGKPLNPQQSESGSTNLDVGNKDAFTANYNKYINERNPYYDSLSYEQKQKILSLSPNEIIDLYESTNDYKIALALLSPYGLSRHSQGSPEESMKYEIESRKHREIVSCKDITKERNQNMGILPLPPGVFEFEVSFKDKEWPDLLFIILDKYHYDGHWQINEAGTSP